MPKHRNTISPDGTGNPSNPSAALLVVTQQALPEIEAAIGRDSIYWTRLADLYRRLSTQKLQIAILGQFKRGKSTFLNALLGQPLLPTGIIPLTAVATFVCWGEQPKIRVEYADGREPDEPFLATPEAIPDVLFRYVAEEANPHNERGVASVELAFPSPLLADGTVLIDTPGVGSTHLHNTQTALDLLPECDAALFVITADPPLTQAELDYLRHAREKTARFFFILNKADLLSPDDRKTAVRFLRQALAKEALLEAEAPIFCVSARDGLAAKQKGDATALARSGIDEIEEHLFRFLSQEKANSLRQAVTKKAIDVLSGALGGIDLREKTLRMPLAQLEQKAAAFENALRGIEAQRTRMADLLAGDRRRIAEALENEVRDLRERTSGELEVRIVHALGKDAPIDEQRLRADLASAIASAFDAARERLVQDFAHRAEDAVSTHEGRLNKLIEEVRHAAAESFDVDLPSDAASQTFKLKRDPYWVTELQSETLIPDAGGFVVRFMPNGYRRMRLRARAVSRIRELVLRNAENLRWSILQSLDELFRAACRTLEDRFEEAVDRITEVVSKALERRRHQSISIEPELQTLEHARVSLSATRNVLSNMQASEMADSAPRTSSERDSTHRQNHGAPA